MSTDYKGKIMYSMTQAKFNELREANGGKLPAQYANSYVYTDAEDVNLSQIRTKLLWTNPNPLNEFAPQTLTLDLTDYDYVMIYATLDNALKYNSRTKVTSMAKVGSTKNLIFGARTAEHIRGLRDYDVTETGISFGTPNLIHNNGTTGLNNTWCTPIEIYGIYKSPAMIYTGAELHEGNGVSIKDGVVSADHPVGSYHICATGSENPAIKFGGTWTQIAENVVLPLGNSANITFTGNLQFQNVTTGNIYTLNTNQATESGVGKVIDAGLWSTNTNVYLNPGQPLRYRSGLSVDLSSATNAIRVDIWRRDP